MCPNKLREEKMENVPICIECEVEPVKRPAAGEPQEPRWEEYFCTEACTAIYIGIQIAVEDWPVWDSGKSRWTWQALLDEAK